MPQGSTTVIDNSFVGGLKTDFTGLNFPTNSCIDALNVTFDRTGLVTRRLGFDYENNFSTINVDRRGSCSNSFNWTNVTGDGSVSIVIVQVGFILYFYKASDATVDSPLSAQNLVSTVDLSDFKTTDGTFDITKECQFSYGNGFLFIFHPNTDPLYCSFDTVTNVVTPTAVKVKIRDVSGIQEDIDDNSRPSTLSNEHKYNILNQGWSIIDATTSGSISTVSWDGTNAGSKTFTIGSGLSILPGDSISATDTTNPFNFSTQVLTGVATSYTGTTLVLNVNNSRTTLAGSSSSWSISTQPGYVETWFSTLGNFPSNSDVWWYFKNSSDVFDLNTIKNVSTAAGPAPRGLFILDAWNEDRTEAASVPDLETVTSSGIRPTTGTWFAGRLWLTGVNSQAFHENLYFSQIVEKPDQFGKCYQINDPTSQERFDLLPSDGGLIVIQGAGIIHKLFPISNGLLVNAERGVWFITGSQGLGFQANDFTVTKISSVFTISPTSFVDVLGYPMWWNEDGIYTVAATQNGLEVNSVTNRIISEYYENIPRISKFFARGYYNPVDFRVQWLFRDTPETDVESRYNFSNILNLDTTINAYYPWRMDTTGTTSINGILSISGAANADGPPFLFKYLISNKTSESSFDLSFGEERDDLFNDWNSAVSGPGVSYDSYFVTGQRLYNQGNKLTWIPYLSVHGVGSESGQCLLQSRWNFTNTSNASKWSPKQRVIFGQFESDYKTKRLRIRGDGLVVQFRFESVPNLPMSLIGWTISVAGNTTL